MKVSIGNCLKLKTLELKGNPDLTVPPTYIVRQVSHLLMTPVVGLCILS